MFPFKSSACHCTRNALIARLVAAVLFAGANLPAASALTQEQITAAALNAFNTKSAGYAWDTQLNYYLNGVGSSPQYEAGLLAWGETYAAKAQFAMYRATGSTQYLDSLLYSGETMYAHRADRLNPPLFDEHRGRMSPAFISFNLNQGAKAKQHAWLVHAAFPSHPVINAIASINKDPDLYAQYGARADALTEDIIETLDSFDSEFGHISGGRGVYYEPYLHYYAPSTNGRMPYNMQNAAGLAYLGLWKATGEQRFRDRAEALARTMKAEFQAVGDRYQWRYAPYSAAGSASDISHAALDVNFAVSAYEAGIVFDDTDVQRLANTMRHIQVGPGFTTHVNGSGAGLESQTRLASLWIPLTRYDAALREEMLPYFQLSWDNSSGLWPTLGSALYYESGLPYVAEAKAEDSFDDLQLSPRWRRPAIQPLSDTWTAQLVDSQLVVSEIDSASSSPSWIDIVRTRAFEQDDSWEVAFDFSWDSDEGGLDPVQAMQRFFVELSTPNGDLIARVGISDGWNGTSGGQVLELFDQSIIGPAGSIALSGSASIRVVSDSVTGSSEIYWDDEMLLSVPSTDALGSVDLRFGRFNGGPGSHFGTLHLDSLVVREILETSGDFDGDSDVDGSDFLTWQRGFGTVNAQRIDGDANGDGLVDHEDLQVWMAQFGTSSEFTASVAVPEPATVWSLLVALPVAFALKRRPGQ